METPETNIQSDTLSIRVSKNVKRDLSRLSKATNRTRSFLAAEAVEAYVARELEIVSGIERGLQDMRTDRVIPHEDAMRELRQTLDHKLRGK